MSEREQRFVVVGTSGSGKSTVAAELAQRIGVDYVELDAIYHRPGWQTLSDGELRARVEEATRGDGWVVDGNHQGLRDVLWPRAQVVVWLDLPLPVVMFRVVRRTIRRAITRPTLWNGNKQRLRDVVSFDANSSVVVLAWATHGRDRRSYRDASRDPRWAQLRFVRLTRTRGAVRRVLG